MELFHQQSFEFVLHMGLGPKLGLCGIWLFAVPVFYEKIVSYFNFISIIFKDRCYKIFMYTYLYLNLV